MSGRITTMYCPSKKERLVPLPPKDLNQSRKRKRNVSAAAPSSSQVNQSWSPHPEGVPQDDTDLFNVSECLGCRTPLVTTEVSSPFLWNNFDLPEGPGGISSHPKTEANVSMPDKGKENMKLPPPAGHTLPFSQLSLAEKSCRINQDMKMICWAEDEKELRRLGKEQVDFLHEHWLEMSVRLCVLSKHFCDVTSVDVDSLSSQLNALRKRRRV